MSCNGPNESINRTFILEPLSVTANTSIFSACTTLFTNLIESCSGNTSITLGTDLVEFIGNVDINGWLSANTFSAITINASSYYSGGTNLLDIINSNDTFLSGATFNDNSLVLKRNDNVDISLLINNFSGLTVNGNLSVTGTTNFSGASSFGSTIISGGTNLLNIFALAGTNSNTYVTGTTFNQNLLSLYRNDDVQINTIIDNFSALTVNGNTTITGTTNISGQTSFGSSIISGGTNLLNIFALAGTDTNTFVSGGTFSNNTQILTLNRNDNNNIQITGFTDYYTTGVTLNNNTLFFNRNDSLSAYTVSLSAFSVNDIFVTGGTFVNNNLQLRNNTGGTFTTLINNFSGITVNGSLTADIISGTTLSATTLFGNGSNISGINFNQLATTAHTHQISDVINLQTSLNSKFSTSGGTVNGDVFILGNVNILGTATTINTTTLSVEDNIITLNSNVTGATQTPLLNSGFEVMRGSATTKSFLWNETNKQWTLDDNTIVNGNLSVTGVTNISGNTSIGGDIISGGTNLSNIFKPINALDVFVTGATFNNSLLTLSKTDNTQINTLINGFTALTVNNNGITTLNGNLTVTGTSNISGNTSIGGNIISGGTNLNNIFKSINSLDVYTTGSTLLNNTIYFNRNNGLSAYSVNISSLISGDTFTSGFTYDNLNNLSIKRNDGVNFNVNISQVSGLTVNGSLSATTLFGNGSNLTGISTQDTKITAFTYNNNTFSIINSTGGTLNALFNTATGLTVNGNLSVTGTTNISGQTSFGGNIISGGTDLSTIFATNSSIIFTGGTGLNSGVKSNSNSVSSGVLSIAEGSGTTASGRASHAEGVATTASGNNSHAEGENNRATSTNSHTEGYNTRASNNEAHAEGNGSTASGSASHAEGLNTTASGTNSHSEGISSIATATASHAEGRNTSATAAHAHSQGSGTTASGQASHAGGLNSIASGNTSFVHSSGSTVNGDFSSILGGVRNFVNYNITGSTILGGSDITATTNDTVYGVNFNASGNIYSGGTNLLNIFSLAGSGSGTNTFVTGGTFNNNLLILTRNDNVQVNTLINNFSALTVNGNITSNNTSRITVSGITSVTSVDSISTGTTNGVTWYYTLKTSTNLRAGTVVAGWIGASVVFTETTTTDIGNTDAVTIAVVQSGGNINLNVTPISGTWTINLNRLLI